MILVLVEVAKNLSNAVKINRKIRVKLQKQDNLKIFQLYLLKLDKRLCKMTL